MNTLLEINIYIYIHTYIYGQLERLQIPFNAVICIFYWDGEGNGGKLIFDRCQCAATNGCSCPPNNVNNSYTQTGIKILSYVFFMNIGQIISKIFISGYASRSTK